MTPDLTATECAIARAALGLSEADLARAAGVPSGAVVALEAGAPVDTAITAELARALAAAGITFHHGPEGSRMRVRTLDGIIETPVTLSKGR